MNLQSAKTGMSSPKNTHINLSHTLHTSTDFMEFKPLLVQEMLPSDSMDITISDYFRTFQIADPVYGQINIQKAAFFVPNRILWKDWNNFMTGGQNGRLTFTPPRISCSNLERYVHNIDGWSNEYAKHATFSFLSDMGLPKNMLYMLETSSNDEYINALPFRAVKRVWYDWYRDSNLIGDELEDQYCPKSGGTLSIETSNSSENPWTAFDILHPMPVPFEKDYFTTAFMEPQRGEDSYAPVVLPDVRTNPSLAHNSTSTTNVVTNGTIIGQQASPSGANSVVGRVKYNALRLAHGIQHWLERNNIAGANAMQQLLAHWGTAPNPLVFNRSVYINKVESPLNVDEVVSTAGEELGDVTTKVNGSSSFHTSYTANEHGWLIVIQIMRPVTGYYQGLDKVLTKFDRFDYFTPELECTGFQPIYNRELYYAGDSGYRDGIFGYVPRYAEYKFKNNRVTCDYDNDGAPHFNRDLKYMFDRGILLQGISTNFSMGYASDAYGSNWDKVFADANQDFHHFWQVCHFKIDASRPMRGYDIPIINEEQGSDTSIPYAGVRL